MKKRILLTIVIFACIQFSAAQKIYLTYKIKTNDSLFIFQEKAISDKNIETKAQIIFQKHVSDTNILSIEDDINRKFIKYETNGKVSYLKLLNAGFYTLYENSQNNDPRYYIYSKTDTISLEKNDSLSALSEPHLNRYQKLASLSKDYPELWPKAKAVKFEKKDIQGFISELNSKYPDKSFQTNNKVKFNYTSISLKGFVTPNRTDIMFDVLKTYYSIGHSPDISLKYGLRVNYYKQTIFVPKYNTGYIFINNGISTIHYGYDDHYETLNAKIFELPFLVNFEITNSKVTPYVYIGLAPTLYFLEISRTNNEGTDKTAKVSINAFTAGGLKLKLTDSFNITTECRYELNRNINFLIGVEYFFKPRKIL
jgi:hypothetical protein